MLQYQTYQQGGVGCQVASPFMEIGAHRATRGGWWRAAAAGGGERRLCCTQEVFLPWEHLPKSSPGGATLGFPAICGSYGACGAVFFHFCGACGAAIYCSAVYSPYNVGCYVPSNP
eukprot:gene16165-biopygen14311